MGEEIDANKLGARIREIRENRKLTQAQLAEKLMISRKTICKWENGVGLPSIQFLKDLADFYQVTIDEILRNL